ncbi:MAG: hypothetical protein P8Y60_00650 [Calditrichota bacterium]|jgi:hypothetical protein
MEKAKPAKKKTKATPRKTPKPKPEQKPDPVETTEPEASAENEPTGKDFETTEEKLRRMGDKLSEAADKGVMALKEVFERVKDFSSDAAELTKLKIEIRNLKSDREKLYASMGKKLWDMKKEDQFRNVQSAFSEDFAKLEKFADKIAEKEKQAEKISL